MHLTDKVLQYLTERQKATGNNCGTYPVSLRIGLNVEWRELKPVLNNLYKQKLITIRPGMKGDLIFLKRKNGTAKNT